MRKLPSDPFAMQARAMSAILDDLRDIGARKSKGFERLDALRQVSISSRDRASANNAPRRDK